MLHAAGVDVQHQQLALGVGQQVLLLAFQHFLVFGKDLALAFADGGGKLLVLRLEVARHAPEVPVRSFRLRRDEVDYDAGGLVLRCGVVTALAGVRHADFDHHMAGRREAADLPAVDRHVVVVEVEAPPRDARRLGERVQLIQGRVAHDVRP